MLGLRTVRGHTFLVTPLRPGSVVLDLGAHLGDFSLELAQRLGCTCLAVEASPELVARIPPDVRVRVVCGAVVSEAGTVTLNLEDNAEASYVGPAGKRAVQIPGYTLSQLFSETGSSNLGLIKVDIEGSEIDVLRHVPGPELRRVGQLSVEFHDFTGRVTTDEVVSVERRLRGLGFTRIKFSVRDHSNVLFLAPGLVPAWRLALLAWVARPLMALESVLRRSRG